jgi:hypothetical protein
LGKARIEFQARELNAETVGTDDPRKTRLGRTQHLLSRVTLDPCRNHHGGAAACFSKIGYHGGHCRRRRRDDSEIGFKRQVFQ